MHLSDTHKHSTCNNSRVLQHVASHMLQRAVSTRPLRSRGNPHSNTSVLQCVGVCWSVLQCVAVCCRSRGTQLSTQVCCRLLQCVAVCCSVPQLLRQSTLSTSVFQSVAVCCILLQCVDCLSAFAALHTQTQACCSVLQCVAVWCSVLQCVAHAHACMLQCVAVYVALHRLNTRAACCCVLHCVAVFGIALTSYTCGILLCVALCYSVWNSTDSIHVQHSVVCCTMLQCAEVCLVLCRLNKLATYTSFPALSHLN